MSHPPLPLSLTGVRLAEVLDDSDLGRPQGPPLQHEPALLRLKHRTGFLPGDRSLEHGLVNVRVKLFAGRVELYHPVPGERLEELGSGHLNPGEESSQGRVLRGDGLGYVFQGGRENVDGGKEVLGELLNGVFSGGNLFRLGSLLQVDKVGFSVGQCGLCLRIHCNEGQIEASRWLLRKTQTDLEFLDLSFQLLHLLRHLLGSRIDLVSGLVDLFLIHLLFAAATVPSSGEGRGRAGGSGGADRRGRARDDAE